jgi:hypothetical protein
VTAFDTLGETEGGERASQICEADVGVGRALNYSLQYGLTHDRLPGALQLLIVRRMGPCREAGLRRTQSPRGGARRSFSL